MSSSGRSRVRLESRFRSVPSSPVAEKIPGACGTTRVGTSQSRWMAFAWTGPAPPKPTSTKSRGSYPRCTEIRWSAFTIAAFAISTIPLAASTASRPSGSAQRSAIARRAPSTSSAISPPRKYAGLRRPRTTFASVTVGSVPPWR